MGAKITYEKPAGQSTLTAGVFKWTSVNLIFLVALGFSLFLTAGRINWGLGWAYLGVLIAGQIATTLLLLSINPTLLGERSWMQKGSKRWDKLIVSLSDVGLFSIVIVAGLDVRFHWTPPLAVGLPLAGVGLLVLGYLVFLWAMASNRFFSSFMRIQTDRGHTVETGGPYRYVRHPGYVGFLFVYIATPLALGSLWTYLPVALIIGLYIYRTALEDRTLQRELDGYVDYARRVRYRLIPGVW